MHSLIGHEDWIRDIDICTTNIHELMIASCSQDFYIRLWKLNAIETNLTTNEIQVAEAEMTSENEESFDGNDDEETPVEPEIKLKSTLFHVNLDNRKYEFSLGLESVLYGHEDFIYSVKWHPFDYKTNTQPLMLLSSSLDKTIVLWKYDGTNMIWLDIVGYRGIRLKTDRQDFSSFYYPKVRAGDIGGNTLGFYGACFDPSEKYIVAHGFQGALHAWLRVKSDEKVLFHNIFHKKFKLL
jgi:elongator complex protein 2